MSNEDDMIVRLDDTNLNGFELMTSALISPCPAEPDYGDETPAVSWTFCFLCVACYLFFKRFMPELSLLGFNPQRYFGINLVTSALAHADLWHLVGNLLFVLPFMSRVEARIGRYNTILFILSAALSTGLIKLIFMGDSLYMALGSSGVCFAYMTFYALAAGGKKFYVPIFVVLPAIERYVVGIPFWIHIPIVLAFIVFYRLRLPIWLITFIFILNQLPGAYLQTISSGLATGGVSHLGHLGGVAAGFIAFYWLDFQSVQKTFGTFSEPVRPFDHHRRPRD